MSAEDRYDHRGAVLDGPDDDYACRHGNDGETCQECAEEIAEMLERHRQPENQPDPMEHGYDGAEERCHGCGNPDILPMDDPFGFPVCVNCKPKVDAEAARAEDREAAYWASQPITVTFEITIDPDGAEVSCGANPAGSWLVNSEEGLPGFGIQSPYPVDRDGEVLVVDTLAEGIGYCVRRMIEAQQDGSEVG